MYNAFRYCLIILLSFSNILNCELAPEKDFVNVRSYGAKGNALIDDYLAIQRAINTGKKVYFPKGRYKVSKTIRYKGRIYLYGEGIDSVIMGDGLVLSISNGSYSQIKNISFENIKIPTLLIRNVSNLHSFVIKAAYSGKGYQPTINDLDAWDRLDSSIKNQKIGPHIFFEKDSKRIVISNINGKFLSIQINNSCDSKIQNCIIRGNNNVFGAIVFCNLGNYGLRNVSENNIVENSSYSGIVFIGNKAGLIKANQSNMNGESGIKLYQNTLDGFDASCYGMTIVNNTCNYNFYDGFDLQSNYPRNGKGKIFHIVKKNSANFNFRTGYITEGIGLRFEFNSAKGNFDSGLNAFNSQSYFRSNYFKNNNRSNTTIGVHQMAFNIGEKNVIENNYIEQISKVGYSIYDESGKSVIRNNRIPNGTAFSGGKVINQKKE
ncbi:hypothetical protein EZ449_19395 [Pedobacter frigidisoli]|uniref:Rhamnogalacturonase A/B/Epimerase-like pectate lyase domain-containing protein n=1 Tax=Pedobacter frigidisoli TaxID=2530455 RepID=A0A4R0NSA2_9SPHI|nr:right-handed parallel beta-helix repeat-containing protein [Pedobacter frigidisoli]TCD01964.1 hypothetical protein EZ449_19395 [Pedobacter frigidisoli]